MLRLIVTNFQHFQHMGLTHAIVVDSNKAPAQQKLLVLEITLDKKLVLEPICTGSH